MIHNSLSLSRWRHLSTGFFALLLPLLALPSDATAVEVEASISPQQARPNQTVTYTITIRNGQPTAAPNLKLPLQIGQNSAMSNSQQFSIINGVATTAFSLSWGLAGMEPGDFVIAPQEVVVDGTIYKTNEVKFTVTQGGGSAADQALGTNGEPEPLLQLVLDKTEVYRGEVIPISAELYVPRTMALRRLGLIDISKDDFAIQRFPQQSEQTQTVVAGIGYNVFTFRSTISALRTGDLQVGPANQELLVELLTRDGRSQSPFGAPFGFPFSEPMKFTVNSQTVPLKVLELPSENKPASFSGAVGDFSLSATASPTTDLKIGDPISIELTIDGLGNFDALTEPQLTEKTGWKTYPSRRYNVDGRQDPNLPPSLRQRIGYSTVLVPEQAQTEIPPFEISFFNPATKQYVTLQTDRIPIQLEAAPVATTEDGSSTAMLGSELTPLPAVDPRPTLTDIVTELPETPRWIEATSSPLISSPLFWFAQAVPVAALFGVIGFTAYRRRQAALHAGRSGQIRTAWDEFNDSSTSDSVFLQRATQFVMVASQSRPDVAQQPEYAAIVETYARTNFSGPTATPPSLPAGERKRIHQQLDRLRQQVLTELHKAPPTAALVAVAALSLALASNAGADDSAEAYQKAKASLEIGKYKEAQYTAEKLLKMEPPALSPDLFQLIGHARYRSEDAGLATLWYRRAQLFDARDAELRQNLRHLYEQQRFLSFAPASPLIEWSQWLSQDEWLILAAIGFWAYLLPLTWRRVSACCRGASHTIGFIGAVVLGVSVVFLLIRPSTAERIDDLSIVVAKDSRAYTSATQTSGTVIDLPPGSEARILEVRGSWSYCELPYPTEPLRGWVENDVLQPLWPFDPAVIP